MTIKQITELQKTNGVYEIQEVINNGSIWMIEGSHGRRAMEYLNAGVCYLPLKRYYDYWGNLCPSRSELKKGNIGSLQHAKSFWSDPKRVKDYFEFAAILAAENGSDWPPLPKNLPKNNLKANKR